MPTSWHCSRAFPALRPAPAGSRRRPVSSSSDCRSPTWNRARNPARQRTSFGLSNFCQSPERWVTPGDGSNAGLFVEHIPHTVDDRPTCFAAVENALPQGARFLRERGLVHFDAHFQNLLNEPTSPIYLRQPRRFRRRRITFLRRHRDDDHFSTVGDLCIRPVSELRNPHWTEATAISATPPERRTTDRPDDFLHPRDGNDQRTPCPGDDWTLRPPKARRPARRVARVPRQVGRSSSRPRSVDDAREAAPNASAITFTDRYQPMCRNADVCTDPSASWCGGAPAVLGAAVVPAGLGAAVRWQLCRAAEAVGVQLETRRRALR